MPKANLKKPKNLNFLRDELSSLAKKANVRASRLGGSSQALKEAQRTLPKSRRGENELFTGNLRTIKQMQREYARIQQFLSDWRSTPEGEQTYEDERGSWEQYKGAFGGQWLKKYGETYDKSKISEDLAKKAFELYDRLVEEYQGEDRARMLWNKNSGKISYGSENMIAAIYDMVNQGYSDLDIMNFAREKMELNYLELQRQADFEKRQDDYGVLDYLASNKSRKEILNELAKRGF